ncbi:hypothetical protein DFAR_1050006 [Desulfarculales bacterium]
MDQIPEIPLGHYVERIKSMVGMGDISKKAIMENYWQATEFMRE